MDDLTKGIMIGLILSTLLLVGCNSQTEEEKDLICYDSCKADGYGLGEHIGNGFCNCYNSTNVNKFNSSEICKDLDGNKLNCSITIYEYNKDLQEFEIVVFNGGLENENKK